jgi:small nuclear ribonucleoprotein F
MEILNPNQYLTNSLGKSVKVKLKWGMSYHGILQTFDSYMNLSLNETEEWINGKYIGDLGQILIRCNNIAYIVENNKISK